MAAKIPLRHKDTGIVKFGFHGFSWTTFFFGPFPALFRGDFMTFVGVVVVASILGLLTLGFGALLVNLAWPFMYNRYYTRRLLERGYRLAGSEGENAIAASALGVDRPAAAALSR